MNLLENLEKDLCELEAAQLKRTCQIEEPSQLVNFSSNDYLGLSRHPKVIAAAKEAVEKMGVGGRSSRLLAGSSSAHQECEMALAQFLNKEAAVVYASGYQANLGAITGLVGKGDVILFDRLCHASIIDGIRLSGAKYYSFKHHDLGDLEKSLAKQSKQTNRVWVMTESIFSMDGDFAPLKGITDLCKSYGAYLYLDEAHALGVRGKDGQGWAQECGVLERVDVFVGTLSKTLGSQGGFVSGKRPIVDWLISRSRPFIYTTALLPAAAKAAQAALELIPAMEANRLILKKVSKDYRSRCREFGFKPMGIYPQEISEEVKESSLIIPLWTGTIEDTNFLSNYLKQNGFFVPSIRPPTVPKGEGRIRISITWDAHEQNGNKLLAVLRSFKNTTA